MPTVSTTGSNSLWNQMQTVRAAQAAIQARQQTAIEQKKPAAGDPMATAALVQQGLAANPGLAGNPSLGTPNPGNNTDMAGNGGSGKPAPKPVTPMGNNLLSGPSSTQDFVASRNAANAITRNLTMQAPAPVASTGAANDAPGATTPPPANAKMALDGKPGQSATVNATNTASAAPQTTNNSDSTRTSVQQKQADQFGAMAKANLAASSGSLLNITA